MNKMKIFSIRKEKNGKINQNGKTKREFKTKSEKSFRNSTQLGIRKISCGLIQYDGIYTLSRIPKRKY
jgi:hypothetical protein